MNGSFYRRLKWFRTAIVLATLLAVGLWGWNLLRLTESDRSQTSAIADVHVTYEWSAPVFFASNDWAVVRRSTAATPAAQVGPLAQRFRLAGTFFAYPGDQPTPGRSGSRHAIVDDLRAKRQHLLQEGDRVEDVEVVSIFRDRIVMRHSGGEEELWLSFSGGASAAASSSTTAAVRTPSPSAPLRFEDLPALETSRFGKRIGEDRWVLHREELLRYADELQEHPERLLALFMAMEPDLNESNEIAGFQLGMLGENILYESAGFQNGDIVRTVNSMPMTSPARAQYFISEFLNGRITALVFDVERDGQEKKLIHLIR